MKFTITDLYFYVMLMFPIATLFQSYFNGINRLLFVLLFLIQIVLFAKRIRKKTMYIILAMVANYLYALMATYGSPDNLNDLFYFPFAVIFLLYMSENITIIGDCLKRNKNFIQFVLNTWSGLVLISLFIPSSYQVRWGGTVYFGSFCQSVFRLAPTAVFIMSLSLCAMIYYEERKFFAYTLLPMLSIYMGGSRTYLLVALSLFMIVWYFFLPSKKIFFLSVLPIGGILIGAVFVSSIADKLQATAYTVNSYFDFWGTISNGRTVFWKAEMDAFVTSGIIQKLFGNGYNYIYDINQKAIGARIWAHNDFLNVLISNGIVGLGLYLYAVKKILRSIEGTSRRRHRDLIPAAGCFVVWFINATFNMFYTYFCALIAFPFLIYAVHRKYKLEKGESVSKSEWNSDYNLPL